MSSQSPEAIAAIILDEIDRMFRTDEDSAMIHTSGVDATTIDLAAGPKRGATVKLPRRMLTGLKAWVADRRDRCEDGAQRVNCDGWDIRMRFIFVAIRHVSAYDTVALLRADEVLALG